MNQQSRVSRAIDRPARTALFAAGLVVILILAITLSLFTGAAANESVILWNIRAPRILAAVIVGAGLSVAGVLLQGALRNPLADPALVGVSAGAALGAVIGAAVGIGYNSALASVFAIIGAIVAMAVVVWIARTQGRIEVVTVLLGGIAITAFASALVAILISTSDIAGARSVSFWTTGSFALANWSGVIAMAPAVVVGLGIALWVAPSLNVLSLGDNAAYASGIEVRKTRVWALLAAVLLTGAGVAVVGIIAFVGLLVPHAVRLIIGPSHRQLMLVSAIAGALVLVLADTVARIAISPVELPVGAVTAIVGAPLFLLLVARTRSRQGGWA
jgi:iron complex transport system permease protein